MKFTPFRIALIYLIVALIWTTTTDTILEYFVENVSDLTNLQIVKGWFYVFATAIGLYVLIKVYENQITTEKKKLQRIDKSLTMALETANTATWEYFVDSDSYITSINHNRLFGYPDTQELSLEHIFDRLHPDDVVVFKNQAAETIETGKDFNIEYRIIDANKQERWLKTKGQTLFRDGRVDRVIGITSDITESKKLRKSLDFEKEKFNSLFEQIPVLITVFNPELDILEVNRQFEEVLGWSPEDQQDKTLIELCYPDKEYREEVAEFMEQPDSGWKEFQVTTKSGEVRTQLWSNLKLSDSTVVGIGHDITERKKLERQNQEDKDKLLEIFNNLPVLIIIYDDEGSVVELNDFAVDLLGYSQQTLLNGDIMHKIFPNKKQYRAAEVHMAKADQTWKNFEIHTKTGDVLKTSWKTMNLSKDLKIGVGLDLTEIHGLEEQLDLAVQSGGIGLWDFNPQNGVIEVNEEWARIIGYSKEELEPLTYEKWKALTHPDDVIETEKLLEKHYAGETPVYDNEIRMRHKDGRWIWMLDRGEVTSRDLEGNVTRITGTHVDIDNQKRLEQEIKESRERLTLATHSAKVGLWEWNPETGEVVFDEIWAHLVGYTLEELKPISIETWNRLVHPADLKKFNEIVQDYFDGKTEIYECELRMRHKDGYWVWILDRGKTVEWNAEGKPIKMAGTHVDITARKEKEEELAESERFLRETQRVANLGTFTLDIESGHLKTSNLLDQMFWVGDDEELNMKRWEELLHPDFKYKMVHFSEAMEKGIPFEAEYKILNRRTNQEKWIYEKSDVEHDDKGKPVRMIGVMLDVTRTKEQQVRIKRTLEQLRIAEKIAEIGYWEKNLDNDTVFWGDNKYNLLEADKTRGPLSRETLFERIHPDDKTTTLKAYKEAEKVGGLDITFRYRNKDGGYRTIREKADIVIDSNSGDKILRGVSMDISDLKEMESELKDERKRLKIITSLVSDVVWDWDLMNKTISWSEGMETVFGYDRSFLDEGESSWIDKIHPEDLKKVLDSVEKACEGDSSFWSQEYRFYDNSDNVRYILDQGFIFRNGEGEATQMIGAMIDQTESKKAERILSYQAKLLRDISDAVIAINEERIITSWNRAAEELYGWTAKEVIGKDIEKVIETDYKDSSEKIVREQFQSKGEWSGEIIQFNKEGKPIHILSSVRMRSDNEGVFKGAVAVNKDITELKQIQQRLDYEQSRFEYVTAVVSDAIWDSDPADKSVWWSEGLETHYKHTRPAPEDGYELWEDNIHPDDRNRVIRDMKKAKESGKNEWTFEYRFYRGDGTMAHVIDRANILRNNRGEIIRIIGAMNDISVQKMAEKKLKRSEQQYRLLYKLSPVPKWIYSPETFRFLSVNEAAIQTYGYTEKEFKELTIFDLFLPEDQEKIRKEAAKNLTQKRSGFDVWPQRVKSGKTIFCEISGSDIFFKDKQQRLVVSVDITEQRKAEEFAIKAVVEGEERERQRIANELHDGLGQYLSAANMHLSTIFSESEPLGEKEAKSFKTGLQMLQYAISETRSISHNLLPKSIQDYGLKLAVEALINDLKSSLDLSFRLFQKYRDEDIPDNVQINVYRILQEAINNAIKHANASAIDTQIIYSDGELICTIEDDGSGFDTEKIETDGLGIQSMKTRVAAMSGNLDIDSKQNIGTLVTVIVPLNKR